MAIFKKTIKHKHELNHSKNNNNNKPNDFNMSMTDLL